MSVVLSEHLPLLASAPNGIQKLRGLILELAVCGKLVPQDPDEEPVSGLLKRIAKERARLETEGACKKPKVAPTVSENEHPFQLPDSWEWIRLGHFCILEMGQSPSSEHYNQSGDGIPFFQGKADFGAKYPTARYWCTEPTKYADNGDVLLSVRAPVGPTNVAQFRCCIGRGLAALRPLGEVPTGFLLLVIQARRSALESLATGTTFVAVSKGDIEPFLVPVPPLAEQHRIVAKVDELMALCDRLEAEQTDAASAHARLVETLLGTLTQSTDAANLAANWQRLAEHFDNLFTTEARIDALKQTVLQLAVMGKLVPQDPSDESANELLKLISQKRARLEAEGSRKKSNFTEVLSDQEQPFPLPTSWKWVRVCTAFNTTSGNTFDGSLEKENGAFAYVKVGDMNLPGNELRITTSSRYIDPDSKMERGLIPTGSIIFPKRGGAIATNKKRIVDKPIFVDLNTMAITPIHGVETAYAYLWLSTIDLASLNTGTSVPQINHKDIDPLPFPLPPLNEQHRIVAKVDELMALCDRLKGDLSIARLREATLADTLIESALEAA